MKKLSPYAETQMDLFHTKIEWDNFKEDTENPDIFLVPNGLYENIKKRSDKTTWCETVEKDCDFACHAHPLVCIGPYTYEVLCTRDFQAQLRGLEAWNEQQELADLI